MWTYSIKRKQVSSPDGAHWAAYSGHGNGLNNIACESVHGIGPTPRGRYRLTWYDHVHGKGSCVAVLTPVGHQAHGRTGLMVHGDSAQMNGTASHGCIILCREGREAWRASGDTDLEVTE